MGREARQGAEGPLPRGAESGPEVVSLVRHEPVPEDRDRFLVGYVAGQFLQVVTAHDQASGLAVYVAQGGFGSNDVIQSELHGASPVWRISIPPRLPAGQS